LNVGETFSFKFFPKYYFPSILFFCHFAWLEENHYFDIYVHDRHGYCHHDKCVWDILVNGPCTINTELREYFVWNSSAASKILFVQQNNTLSLQHFRLS